MTQRESGQDFDPKHRIIGAIVVVALAVIFIPMILRNHESPAERSVAQSPAPDEPAVELDKVAVTKLPPPVAATESVRPPTKTETSRVAPPPPKPPEKKATASSPPAPAKKARVSNADAKHPNSGWVVQVGTFSNVTNATRLEKKLRAEGHPVLVEHITLGGKKAVRLRVGPFRDRTAALKARARIDKEVGLQGVVLAYP